MSPALQAAVGLVAFVCVAVLLAGAVDRFGARWTSLIVFGLLVVVLVLEAVLRSSAIALAGGVIVLVAGALVWVLQVTGCPPRGQ